MKRHLLPLTLLLLAASRALAGTTTAEVGAIKIHGGGYQCASFEGDYDRDPYDASATGSSKEQVLAYGILASSAYVDRGDAADFMNNGQGRVDNWKLLGTDKVSEVSAADVRKYLGGDEGLAKAGLRVEPQALRANETSVGKNATEKDYKDTDKYPTSSEWKDVDNVVTVSGSDPDKLNVRFFMQDDGTLVLSFRGTAGASDIRDDAKQATHLGPIPQQYKDAAKVLENVLANYPGKVVCTGHSLGGGLVQYAMASNDLQGRVDGYVYNSAGLNGLQTVNTFDKDKAIDAAAHIVGVRSDGDPVSFVGYHLLKEGKMYEVATEVAGDGEHSIKALLLNMAYTMESSALTDKLASAADRNEASSQQAARDQRTKDRQAQYAASSTTATTTPSSLKDYIDQQISANPDVQRGFDDFFDKVYSGLDTFLDASTAREIADKLEELAKKGAVAAGGAVDKAVQAQIDKLKSEIVSLMPGDDSKTKMGALVDDLLKGVATGDFSAAVGDLPGFGSSLAGDYAAKLVDGMDLPAEEKAALKKTVSDAVQECLSGSGLAGAGAAVKADIEAYVYGKIESTLGKDTADKWEKVYTDIQAGNDPWANGSIQAAAKQTAIVLVDKAIDKLGDLAWKRIQALAKKYPAVAAAMEALGINKQGLINAAKNIWGALTGPGAFADRLKNLAWQAAQGLAKMAKNLISWLGSKAAAWINAQISKLAAKIWAKIQNWLKNLPFFGKRIDFAKIYNGLVAKLQVLVSKGVQAVVTPVATKVETAITNASWNIIYGTP